MLLECSRRALDIRSLKSTLLSELRHFLCFLHVGRLQTAPLLSSDIIGPIVNNVLAKVRGPECAVLETIVKFDMKVPLI